MILLYSFCLLFLGAVKLMIDRRVARLERRHSKVAQEADRLMRVSYFDGGQPGKSDPGQAAKRQYVLGQLVQRRDRLEAKHDGWQAGAERVTAWAQRLRNWRGKKLPYTFGVVDVSGLLYLVDYCGVGNYVSVGHI